MSVEVATDRLAVQLLHPDARPPMRTRPGDAGFDLCCLHAFELAPSEAAKVPTGLAVAIPPGVAGLILPRSGLAARFRVTVVNGPGLIDPNYRGEVCVLLQNLGDELFAADAGDRVAGAVPGERVAGRRRRPRRGRLRLEWRQAGRAPLTE